MTATIHDVSSGEVHAGRHIDSIVRRVWGQRAHYARSLDPNNPHDMVVSNDQHGSHVLATVIADPRPPMYEWI
jgi:hypothetical protein